MSIFKTGATQLAAIAAAGILAAQAAPAQAHFITERVSVGSGGVQGNAESGDPSISADGRFVAFVSSASNLVPGDTNRRADVFVRDRRTGTTRRVSLGAGGAQGNGDSSEPALSANGRFVAFYSEARNLVPGDTNGQADVFVRDRRTGTTRRVSLGSGGSQSNGASVQPALSADGRFVAFISDATNLVPGDTNGLTDVFVRDRQTGTTRRVSLGAGGAQGNWGSVEPAVSADGRFVAFTSLADNLVPGDTNGITADVFVRDRQTGTTRRVSVGPGGVQSDGNSQFPALSADGRFVAFWSQATNLVPTDTNGTADVFVRDRQTGTTRRVNVGPGGVQANDISFYLALSADGRFVAFSSFATNLVPGDTNGSYDVFVRDRQKGTTRRVSLGPGGAQGNDSSYDPAVSADGRFVAFSSDASNLVPGDTNGFTDVFVRIPAP